MGGSSQESAVPPTSASASSRRERPDAADHAHSDFAARWSCAKHRSHVFQAKQIPSRRPPCPVIVPTILYQVCLFSRVCRCHPASLQKPLGERPSPAPRFPIPCATAGSVILKHHSHGTPCPNIYSNSVIHSAPDPHSLGPAAGCPPGTHRMPWTVAGSATSQAASSMPRLTGPWPGWSSWPLFSPRRVCS